MTTNTNDKNLTNNHVVAVINGTDSAGQATTELSAAGYTNPIILTGEEGARQIDAKGENSHVFARILSMVEDHLSEATNYMRQYEEEARSGKQVIALEVADREHADGACEILTKHGATNVRFFGKLAITDLTPETNPSLRAEESPEPQRAT
jgi:hypothetical protein